MKPRRGWRMAWLAGLAAALALAGLWGFGLYEAHSLPRIRRTEVTLPALPPGTPPLRIALLSDIHIGNRAMDAAHLAAIVGMINAQRPDVVLIAGDMTVGHHPEDARAHAPALVWPLAGLRPRLGSFAVAGNHEYWTDRPLIMAMLRRAGVAVLDNEAARAGPLAIVGVSDGFTRHADLPRALASAAKIGGVPVVFTHSPDIAPQAARGAALVMAGHTHCGQVVLPLVGSLAEQAPRLARLTPRSGFRRVYDPRFRCGPVRLGNATLIVTGGLGSGSIPIRLGAPPDFWIITVKPVA